MPPSMENTEYRDRLIVPKALKVQKVYPKFSRTLSNAIPKVKAVHSRRKPLMTVNTSNPASADVNAYSMLIRMPLPR